MNRLFKTAVVIVCLIVSLSFIFRDSPVAHSTGERLVIWANNIGRNPEDPPYLTMNYRIRRMYFKVTSLTTKSPVVFFGDSITFGADWQTLFPEISVVNRGISGDTTLGLLNRLDEVIELQPRQIFLMIGTNDLCFGRPPEKILENYQLILDRLHRALPGTPIYIQSVLPFNDTMFPSRGLRKNSNIHDLNIRLKEVAQKNGCLYIDLATAFTGEDGRLSTKYTYDGLHLNEFAYLLWKNQIGPLIDTVGKSS